MIKTETLKNYINKPVFFYMIKDYLVIHVYFVRGRTELKKVDPAKYKLKK